jgi:hypothetical protein
MESEGESYSLEAIAQDHLVAVGMFVPFAIARLRRDAHATETLVRVTLRGIDGPEEAVHALRLSWAAESVPVRPLAVQENVLTEWAALAVACVVLSKYTAMRIREVAVQGDSFDYWVTDGQRDYGLEVSGTLEEDIEKRHREKVQQLLANPYRADGYAIAVRFASPEILFSFHRFAEKPT